MISCNVCKKGWVNLGDRYRQVSKCGCVAAYRLPPVCKRRCRVLRCCRAGCTSQRPARCAQSCRAATHPTCLSPVVHPRTHARTQECLSLQALQCRSWAGDGCGTCARGAARVLATMGPAMYFRASKGACTWALSCAGRGAACKRRGTPAAAKARRGSEGLRLAMRCTQTRSCLCGFPAASANLSPHPPAPGFCPDTWNAAGVCRTCAQLGCPRACAAGAGCRRCPRGSVRLHTTPPLGLRAGQWHGYCTGLRPAPFEPVPKLPAVCLRAKEVRHRVPGRSPARPPAAWQPCAGPCSVSASGMMLH